LSHPGETQREGTAGGGREKVLLRYQTIEPPFWRLQGDEGPKEVDTAGRRKAKRQPLKGNRGVKTGCHVKSSNPENYLEGVHRGGVKKGKGGRARHRKKKAFSIGSWKTKGGT